MSPQNQLPSPGEGIIQTFLRNVLAGVVVLGGALFFIFVVAPIIAVILAAGLILAVVVGIFGWWQMRKFRKRLQDHLGRNRNSDRVEKEESTYTGAAGRPSRKINVTVHDDE